MSYRAIRQWAMVATLVLGADAAQGATFVVHNLDGSSEGLNDPTLFAPGGGNEATTLGDARFRAVERMLSQVLCHFQSAVPIEVNVHFDPMSCTPTSGTLGAAGATVATRDFPNAPLASTFYPIALANALAGIDLDGTKADVNVIINSDVGTANCLSGVTWYYGFDATPPPTAFDFITVGSHEMMHGFGFITFTNLATGVKLLGMNDAYMVNLEHAGAPVPSYPAMSDAQRVTANVSDPNLRWIGGDLEAALGDSARMYAPNPLQLGSSVFHLSTVFSPNQLLEPSYTGPNHDLGLALPMLSDVGWTAQSVCPATPAPATPSWASALLAALLPTAALMIIARGARRKPPQQKILPAFPPSC